MGEAMTGQLRGEVPSDRGRNDRAAHMQLIRDWVELAGNCRIVADILADTVATGGEPNPVLLEHLLGQIETWAVPIVRSTRGFYNTRR